MAIQAPLFRWPGGKRALLPHLLPLLPRHYGRYFEPFVGGGALFFALRPIKATLSDIDTELINCYTQVRDNHLAVFSRLARLENSEAAYYAIRASQPRTLPSQAARLIYLTSLSFNGLYRRNREGHFNVPYGQRTHRKLPNCLDLERISDLLCSIELKCGDFEEIARKAIAGDLIYFDPPYTVAHGQNGFLKYNARIFSWSDQVRLASLARKLSARGCKVIVSNACHPSVEELYKGSFHSIVVSRHSTIAGQSKHRQVIKESIFLNP